jgi:hypothetical protein
VLGEADKELKKLAAARPEAEGVDNRVRLNGLFGSQRTTRAKDVVKELGRNFDAPADAPPDEKSGKQAAAGDKLNAAWLYKSKLADSKGSETTTNGEKADEAAKGEAGGSLRFGSPVAKHGDDTVMFTNPGIAAKQDQGQWGANRPAQVQAGAKPQSGSSGGQDRGAVQRYQEQLERKPQAGVELQTESLSLGIPEARRDLQPKAGTVQRRRGDQMGDISGGGYFVPQMGGMPAQPPPPHASIADGPSVNYPDANTWAELNARKAGLVDAQGAIQRAAAGLTSLDFEVPKRGTLYRFTTPGGDVKITARAASDKLLVGLAKAVAVLVAAGVVVLIGRRAGRGGFAWLAGPFAAAAMILLGFFLLFVGFLVAGLLLLVLGTTLLVRRALRKRTGVRAAAAL